MSRADCYEIPSAEIALYFWRLRQAQLDRGLQPEESSGEADASHTHRVVPAAMLLD